MSRADWLRQFPWTIAACALALMLLGLSGIARGDELTASGDYFSRQLMWVALAVPVMIAAACVPYRWWVHAARPLFAVSLLLLTVVYLCPAKNGSHRWIPLGVMNFQPSELAKLSFIFLLADYLRHRDNYRSLTGLVWPFAIALLPMALILREPDLGTSLVFLPVLFGMLFAAGARARHLAFVCVMGAATAPVLWLGMSAEQRSRVVTLFNQEDGGEAPKGDGYHLHQSKQVLALGGLWGSEVSGMPLADPLAYHLPAARTDFIFCLVGERWGFLGGVLTLLLYLILCGRGLAISASTREPFGRLLAVGVVMLLATQAIINAAMTVGLMPITGLTLPLMSYGGSSLLATAFAIGLLLSVGLRPGYEVAGKPFRF